MKEAGIMDNRELWTLLMDVKCMTAFSHVSKNPAIAAMIRLLTICGSEHADPEALRNAYIDVYSEWLRAAANGRGGFARETLEAVLFEDSPAAELCARMNAEDLPYSLVSSMARDLETLGQMTAIEPAMCLLLCQRAGMTGETAARLPVWEPSIGVEPFDPRIDRTMLSRDGVGRVAAFFRHQGTGLFARCPGSIWVGISDQHPLGLRGIRGMAPIHPEHEVIYQKERTVLEENTKRLLSGHKAANLLLCGEHGVGKSAVVKALLNRFWLDGLRIVEMPETALEQLPELFSILGKQPGKFIVYIDEVALDAVEYRTLKAVLESGLEARPENVVLYATSDVNPDAWQPGNAPLLADSFEKTLMFEAPTLEEYGAVCRALLDAHGVEYDWEALSPKAKEWADRHGDCSLRAARQFARWAEAAAQPEKE